ncbi:hypothetical protein [Marinobacter sp.]|uniref:hypothetical protein n=1 Tax=Marinobacter sp. TaxID=50741 RepID=UPI00260B85F7|nr:hypothetical protein [Marinobacter sp.]
MLDDRTLRRAPKAETLKIWPNATCQKVTGAGFVILSRECDQPKFIGEGRSAWAAWMDAETHPRNE